jgi:hypothetical protein
VSDQAADVERSCLGKNRYGSEADAHAVATECFRVRGIWLRVYACVECGGYHLTKRDAAPPSNANWRPPAKSQRQLARERNQRQRRRRR